MAACEKCWGEAYLLSKMTGREHHVCYLEILNQKEREGKVCTKKEQAGLFWNEKEQRQVYGQILGHDDNKGYIYEYI